jgi:hypothetical protein
MAIPLAAVAAFLGRAGLRAAQKRFGRTKVKQAQEMAMPGGTKARVKGSSAKDKGGSSSQPKDTSTQMPGGTTADPRSASMLKGSRDATRTRRHGKRKQRATQRDKQAAIGLGSAAVTSLAGAAFGGKEEKKPSKPTVTKGPTGVKNRSGSTPSPRVKTQKTTTPDTKVTASRPSVKRPTEPESPPKPPKSGPQRTVKAAKKSNQKTFIDKKGRRKAAVTKEELEKSGLSLRDYLNRERGLTRREGMKTGGTVKKGGKVRGVRIAKKGFRPAKIR